MKKSFWITLASSLGYLVVALACLICWGQQRPLQRLDYFAGAYLVLRLIGCLHSLSSSRTVFDSTLLRKQWWALDSDPAGPQWVMVLMALDLVVFLDYSHWRLTPWLVRPVLQSIGVVIYIAVTFWQMWADSYLARYFNRNQQPLLPMNNGPYRYVRHPRYAAAIIGKIAMALIFASAFGWLLAIAWGMLLLNKIAIEEEHMRKVFGWQYDSYSRTTARLIPGIY
jgi:protein-S-isoprenylcysteine O-methyltransferase Ste14